MPSKVDPGKMMLIGYRKETILYCKTCDIYFKWLVSKCPNCFQESNDKKELWERE